MGTLTGWHPSRPGCSPRRSRGERERLRSRGEALTQSALCLTRLHMCPRRGQAGGEREGRTPEVEAEKGRERQETKFHRLPKQSRRNCFQRHFGAGPPGPYTPRHLAGLEVPLQLPGLEGGGWQGRSGACWRKSPKTRLGIQASDCPEPGGGVAEKSGPIWLVHMRTPDAHLLVRGGRVGNPRAPKAWPLKPGPP